MREELMELNYVSIKDAATMLTVHPNTVRNMIKSGELKAYRIGNKIIRIKVEDIWNAFVETKDIELLGDK